jgi:hypothetical protein
MHHIPHVGVPAIPLHLAQPWLDALEPAFQSATALVHWSDTNLHLQVTLTDRHIFSASTDHSQSLHLLGDTLEIFLMLPDAPEYYELHVSPHNHRTTLRWPLGGIEKYHRNEVGIESFRETPDAFDTRIQLLETGWEVALDLPHTLLGLDRFVAGQNLLLSLSRYDYRDLATAPVLSTSAAHRIRNFHRPEDWLRVELV